eukprot:1760418-Prymnesium_polylepis.1
MELEDDCGSLGGSLDLPLVQGVGVEEEAAARGAEHGGHVVVSAHVVVAVAREQHAVAAQRL